MAEPSRASATAKPSSQEAAPDQTLMASTAPLMTAVSKPNRKPPIAADPATSAIRPMAVPPVDPGRAGLLLSMVDMGLADPGLAEQRHDGEFDTLIAAFKSRDAWTGEREPDDRLRENPPSA